MGQSCTAGREKFEGAVTQVSGAFVRLFPAGDREVGNDLGPREDVNAVEHLGLRPEALGLPAQ